MYVPTATELLPELPGALRLHVPLDKEGFVVAPSEEASCCFSLFHRINKQEPR